MRKRKEEKGNNFTYTIGMVGLILSIIFAVGYVGYFIWPEDWKEKEITGECWEEDHIEIVELGKDFYVHSFPEDVEVWCESGVDVDRYGSMGAIVSVCDSYELIYWDKSIRNCSGYGKHCTIEWTDEKCQVYYDKKPITPVYCTKCPDPFREERKELEIE